MDYRFDCLNPKDFENLVQALCKKIIGEGVKVFGAGPDGQREATFNGKANYPSTVEQWDGYWVIQAKYKSTQTKTDDYVWIRNNFIGEMTGFEEKKKKGKQIPNNYLFFTNIVLTPVEEKGIRDRMDILAQKYKSLIPNIHILGTDDLARFLDGHRDVATTYTSFLMSGDVLNSIYDTITEQKRIRNETFLRYLYSSFKGNLYSRMEQAGQVSSEKVSIDKVYTDLDFTREGGQEKEKFINKAIAIGNVSHRFSLSVGKSGQYETDRETPEGTNRYVLKGSAGQGKSTVCQFLSQIYRASFLKQSSNRTYEKVDKFLVTSSCDGIVMPKCLRIPFCIELRMYSSWILKQLKENKPYDLVSYMSFLIESEAAGDFDNETLREYFRTMSWAFFFDGLDEVPETSNRTEVLEEIERFIDIELRQADADAVFYATTRPDGYLDEFPKSKYLHLKLCPLDRESCFSYLRKLFNNVEGNKQKRQEYMQILERGWDNDQIAHMMQTPLQATIIAILVRAGGEPPRDKYTLYKDYFSIIINRERQKGGNTILNTNQTLIENIYYYLGYELQTKSSTVAKSDALVSVEEMHRIIENRMENDGIVSDDPNYDRTKNEAYNMIVQRINFASEIKDGYIGFSIRSIQEFLAAIYIVRTFNDELLKNAVTILAQNAYWKNTFLFLVECVLKEKVYFVDTIIDTVLGELNGKHLSEGEKNALACVQYGSRVALELLISNIFDKTPKYENKLCKLITGTDIALEVRSANNLFGLSDNVKKQLAWAISKKENIAANDIFFIASLLDHDECNGILKDKIDSHWHEILEKYIWICQVPSSRIISIVCEMLNRNITFELHPSIIAYVIREGKEQLTQEGKNALFRVTVKAKLNGYMSLNSPLSNDEASNVLNDYFKCDFDFLECINRYRDETISYVTCDGGYFGLTYQDNRFDSSKIDDILIQAKASDMLGLAALLTALKNKDLDSYLLLNEMYDICKCELKDYDVSNIIYADTIIHMIFDMHARGNGAACKENIVCIMNERVVYGDSSIAFPIWLSEMTKDYSDYFIGFVKTKGVFVHFWNEIRRIYAEEDIMNNAKLHNLLVRIFLKEYNEASQTNDQEAIIGLNKFLPIVLRNINSPHNLWETELSMLMLHHLSIKELLEFDNFPPNINKDYRSLRLIKMETEDREQIVKKAVLFACIKNSAKMIDVLITYIINFLNHSQWNTIDWSQLSQFDGDKRIVFLKMINSSNSEDEVMANVIPHMDIFEDGDEISFCIKALTKNRTCPRIYLPILVYFLNRTLCQKERESVLRQILTLIHTCPVDLLQS